MTRDAGLGRINRREWLTAAGALAGASAVGYTSLSRGDEGTPEGPFKLGLQSYSLRGLVKDGKPDLALALEATKELGVHYWEAFPAHVPLEGPSRGGGPVKAAMDAAKVTLAGYGVVPLGLDAAANRQFFEFAKRMGIEYLSADPDPKAMDGIDRLIEAYGIGVGIHNHGPGHRYSSIESIKKVIDGHHPKMGCCIDTGHFLRSKIDPVDAAMAFAGRTYGVHLKDVKNAETFTILGKGDLRLVDLLKVLAKEKYHYCLAIEYEENPDKPMDDLKACLATARHAIAEVAKA